jgi:hypothetical protein
MCLRLHCVGGGFYCNRDHASTVHACTVDFVPPKCSSLLEFSTVAETMHLRLLAVYRRIRSSDTADGHRVLLRLN